MIASLMRPVPTSRGTHIVKQGADADRIFFLQRGVVEVVHMCRRVALIVAPATFGEVALLAGDMENADKQLSGYRTTATSMCGPVFCGSGQCADGHALMPRAWNPSIRLRVCMESCMKQRPGVPRLLPRSMVAR